MLHDEIIRLPVAEQILQVIHPFMREMRVHRVHHGNLIVENDIGVVGHAVRHGVLSLKQVNGVVVDAGIADIVRNIHDVIPLFVI